MTTARDSVWRDAFDALPDAASLSPRALLEFVDELGVLQARLDAVKLGAVGQVLRRWNQLDEEGLVLRGGHRHAVTLVAERWQVAVPAARQVCLVAQAVTPRVGLTGEILPAGFPALASALDPDALEAGWVSVDQAAVIVRELGKAAPACTVASLQFGERVLVQHAPGLTVAELRVLAGQVRDRLDQDGVLPREEVQRSRRSLTISTTSDGLTHIDWYLHPEAAGHVVAAIDTLVGHELRAVRFRDTNGPDFTADRAEEEHRTLPQLRSDAAVDVFRHYATHPGTGSTPPVTMVVRIGLTALQTGTGVGEIDGVSTPISATTARRLAADANLIPVVLGGDGEVLDLGRSRRLFSSKQKLALAERDGGCAWAGCPHPPSYTEAHHIRWWDKHHGATDLNNGVLLCSNHHHRVHDDGWDITVRDHVPWFIPPSHIDHHRRPRRGGRIRLQETAA
ncbi:DUF222 domain-containing protein [Leifsonia sp. NPDC058292]|uniref:DUF222 domain-containing protein n=1 Tax=Leifsonia sp. NPDC058292 TaxID=3346428 RepID=UPI0036DB46B0